MTQPKETASIKVTDEEFKKQFDNFLAQNKIVIRDQSNIFNAKNLSQAAQQYCAKIAETKSVEKTAKLIIQKHNEQPYRLLNGVILAMGIQAYCPQFSPKDELYTKLDTMFQEGLKEYQQSKTQLK